MSRELSELAFLFLSNIVYAVEVFFFTFCLYFICPLQMKITRGERFMFVVEFFPSNKYWKISLMFSNVQRAVATLNNQSSNERTDRFLDKMNKKKAKQNNNKKVHQQIEELYDFTQILYKKINRNLRGQ